MSSKNSGQDERPAESTSSQGHSSISNPNDEDSPDDFVPIDHWDPEMANNSSPVVQLLRNNHPEQGSDSESDEANGDWVINNDFYDLDLLDDSFGAYNPDAQPPIYEVEDIEEVSEDDTNDEVSETESQNSTYEEVVGEEAVDNEIQILNYDTSLPVRHQYLGENLQELPGRQILDEDEQVELPLLTRMSITEEVLLPGQTLPLTCANIQPHFLQQLLTCIKRGQKTFGLTSFGDLNPGILGTTAEVRNYGLETDEMGDEILTGLILQGRQKFKLVSVRRAEGFHLSTVRIIPEAGAQSPFQLQGSLSRLSISKQRRRFDRYKSNKFPPWVHQSFDAQELTDRILLHLKHWFISPEELTPSPAQDSKQTIKPSEASSSTTSTASQVPSSSADTSIIPSKLRIDMDPVEFSYWIAANLPLCNTQRAHALTFNSAISRLQWELSLIEEATHLCCARCNATVCRKEDVFSMSRAGPQSSFVNEHGCIHDTLTVLRVERILYHKNMRDVTKYSWFPGYAWSICSCCWCHSHLGWRFKAESTNPSLKPQVFWGLSRRNIRLGQPREKSPDVT